MRVSAQTKAATREKILECARRLFGGKGFDATTTRDIADEAGIASGTLFNYFATKEAVVAALAAEAVADVGEGALNGERAETLEEELFAFIAAGLRKLKPFRKSLPALLETTLSPLSSSSEEHAASFRVKHLETVTSLAAKHGQRPLSPVAMHLYWTLYMGVLLFWSQDKSPKQEETLALIDDSLEMFVTWLRGKSRAGETD